MVSPGGSECPSCRLPFVDATQSRQNACPFCNRTFGRVDGARRHAKSCPARGNRPLPPAAKRGRKPRACEECARIKVLCDGKVPCQRCSSRSLDCTFARLCMDPAHLRESKQSTDRQHLSQSVSTLRFLLNCTDPRTNLVNDVLVAGEPESDSAMPATWNQAAVTSIGHDTINPQLLLLGFMDPYLDMSLDFDGIYDTRCSGGMAPMLPGTPNDSLTAQVCLLKADIQQLISTRPEFDDVISNDSFSEFFTCGNFQKLMMVFFRRRQLLARMIHRPTFNPSNVDLGLLLAIALCGAAYSHKSAEYLQHTPITGTLQQLADKYIFRRLKQCHGREGSRLELEICQAAYLIVVLQMSVNDGDTRRRAIAKRQPALVDALRRLRMLSSKHNLPTPKADWHTFAYRESCVRLAAFATFNDGFLALLCNSPPTTTVSEMSGDLPCRDELWEADCPTRFEEEQNRGEPISRPPCMKDLLAGLLKDDWDNASSEVHHSLSVFHLYAAIGVFQFILFNYRANMLPKSFDPVLLRALTRWEQLWYATMQRIAPEQQSWLGVAKYSPEFALISRRIIEVGATEEGCNSKYLQCTPEYDVQAFHDFILQHGVGSATLTPTDGRGS